MQVTGGATNVTTYFMMRSTTDGTAATGLTITTFDLQYTRTGSAPSTKVDATSLAGTDSAHSDNQMIEIDSTSSPGLYRVDWPDAAFAAGAAQVFLSVKYSSAVFTEVLAVDIDPPVDVTKVSGDSTAADNLELDYDGTGYAKANSTIGTCTTNTDLVSAASIADAVWDEATADHTGDGTFGLANNCADCGTASAGAAGTITLDAGSASTTADLYNGMLITLVGGTGAGQSRLITDYSAARVASVEPNWTTTPDNTSEYFLSSFGNVNLRTATQTSVDAIETDTNSLNDTKVPQTLNLTASGNIGIDWANVENPTTSLDLSGTDIQLVDTATTVTNQVSADVTAISGTSAAADKLEASAGTIVTGAATSTTLTTTTMSTNLTEATDDHYNGRIIIWTSGVLQNQATDITDYTGATKLLTFTAVTEAPSDTDTFVIV